MDTRVVIGPASWPRVFWVILILTGIGAVGITFAGWLGWVNLERLMMERNHEGRSGYAQILTLFCCLLFSGIAFGLTRRQFEVTLTSEGIVVQRGTKRLWTLKWHECSGWRWRKTETGAVYALEVLDRQNRAYALRTSAMGSTTTPYAPLAEALQRSGKIQALPDLQARILFWNDPGAWIAITLLALFLAVMVWQFKTSVQLQ